MNGLQHLPPPAVWQSPIKEVTEGIPRNDSCDLVGSFTILSIDEDPQRAFSISSDEDMCVCVRDQESGHRDR